MIFRSDVPESTTISLLVRVKVLCYLEGVTPGWKGRDGNFLFNPLCVPSLELGRAGSGVGV